MPVLCLPFMLLLAGAVGGADAKFPAGKIRKVQIMGVSGEVKVRGTQPAQARVHTVQAAGACDVQSSLQGSTLRVAVGGCRTDLEVFVPMKVDTQVEASAGTVYVSGVRGALSLKLGHVNAVVGGQLTALNVQGEETALSATGMLGDSEILIHSGNVQLWYDKQARHGLVLLNIDDGNVTVSLPGSTIACKVRLDQGDLQHDLDLAPTAPFVLDGVLAHGSLFVRQAQ